METDCCVLSIYWAFFFVFICGFSNWKTWKEIFPINWQTETNKNSYANTIAQNPNTNSEKQTKKNSKRKYVVHSLNIKFHWIDRRSKIHSYTATCRMARQNAIHRWTSTRVHVHKTKMFIFVQECSSEECSTRIYSLTRLELLEHSLSTLLHLHIAEQ